MAQHQTSRPFVAVATMATTPRKRRNSYTACAAKIFHPGRGTSRASSGAYTQDNFEDSGFVDAGDDEYPACANNAYQDFILYESDSSFIDEEASIRPNNGSIYSGGNNNGAAYFLEPPSDTQDRQSSPQPASNFSRTAHTQDGRPAQLPSLFGEFELVHSGPSLLQQWVMTPHHHEATAYRFEQLPYSSPANSYPSSPATPHSRGRSGKKHGNDRVC